MRVAMVGIVNNENELGLDKVVHGARGEWWWCVAVMVVTMNGKSNYDVSSMVNGNDDRRVVSMMVTLIIT